MIDYIVYHTSVVGLIWGIICLLWTCIHFPSSLKVNSLILIALVVTGISEPLIRTPSQGYEYAYSINNTVPAWLFYPQGFLACMIVGVTLGLMCKFIDA